MYKTVRHGENSLQYTILPQHEEGSVLVKPPRKSKKKGKTAAVLTITTILICGVIATAVLVPLLLTSDLVALPAAFQKFSVSSLHRSHGNRLTILAKEPYGWTKSHHTSSTQSPTHPKIAENDNTHKTKVAITSIKPTTTTTTSTSSTTTTTTTTTKKPEPTTEKATTEPEILETIKDSVQKVTPDKSFARIYSSKNGEIPSGNHYIVLSTTSTVASQPHNPIGDNMILYVDTNLQSSPSPWFNQHWPFSDASSYLKWSRYNLRDNLLLPIALGGIFVTICVIVILVTWLKRRASLRSRSVGKSTDTKSGDKATLLKETAMASEEE